MWKKVLERSGKGQARRGRWETLLGNEKLLRKTGCLGMCWKLDEGWTRRISLIWICGLEESYGWAPPIPQMVGE